MTPTCRDAQKQAAMPESRSNRVRRLWLVALPGVAAILAWIAAPFFVADPMPSVLARTPARTWCDRNGVPLYCERTWMHEWRFDVPLSEISTNALAIMIATEDARFYRHHGIDYRAILRAFFQNAASLRIISGASTISMQTAAMDYHSGRRSLLQKFIQAAKARKMERLHTKSEILEAYFNNLPFGGNIYGIEAASSFYFGMHARDLGLDEAAMLCGLPQRPNRLRPDRHPEAALRRRDLVLEGLVRRGVISAEEAAEVMARRPRFRDFSIPAPFEQIGAAREWSFVIPPHGPMRHGNPQEVRLQIDAALTRDISAMLKRRAEAAHGVRDAAAIVIDIQSGDVIAHVGTLDFDSPFGGQVDAASAIRSAGSTIKPFIYAEAIGGGMLVADSPVEDAPIRFADYRPENFGGGFAGRITAAQALSRSLNTPAVRLLARLGLDRISARLDAAGLSSPGQSATNGLSLALGTAGYRLDRLTAAYATLAPKSRDGNGDAAQMDAADGVRAMIGEMLRSLPLPGTSLQVAWKTGTSNNNCDAWCFAYTPDFAVGVWFGNKDGTRSDSLVGAEIAAPAAGEIFERLYARRPPPSWPFPPDYQRKASLCASSGLIATPSCPGTIEGMVLEKTPLALCESCGRTSGTPSIASPAPVLYRLADGAKSIKLDLDAGGAAVSWFVDGSMLPEETKSASFGAGHHRVTAIPLDSPAPSAQVEFSVLR